MPNHITNELRSGSAVHEWIGDDWDFNRLIPMPDVLKGHEPDMSVTDWAKLTMGVETINDYRPPERSPAESFKAEDYGAAANALHAATMIRTLREGPHPKDYDAKRFAAFLKCLQAIHECGYAYWYDWCNDKWGTKWGAYEVEIAPDLLRFQTAWSTPRQIWIALAEKFPEETLRIRWADEDFGRNVGDLVVRGSEIVEDNTPEDGGREARELALDVIYQGEIPDYMARSESGELVYLED